MGLFSFLFGEKNKVALKEIYANGAVVIDVRSVEEYKSGHFKDSVNIPLQNIAQKINWIKQKNMPVIAVCKSGARSGMAVSLLKNAGIEVYNGGPWTSLQQKLA